MADMAGGGAGGHRLPEEDPIIQVRESEWEGITKRVEMLESRMDNMVKSHAAMKKTADAVRTRQMMDEPIGGPGNSVTDLED